MTGFEINKQICHLKNPNLPPVKNVGSKKFLPGIYYGSNLLEEQADFH